MKLKPTENYHLLLHKMILEFCLENNVSQAEALAFLSLTFTGTLAIAGYSEDFVEKTFERMKEQYKTQKEKIKKDYKDVVNTITLHEAG